MVGKKQGGLVVASGVLVPSMRVAGLERAARLAGEAFAYEELSGSEMRRGAEFAQSHRLWWAVALVALIGLTVVALR